MFLVFVMLLAACSNGNGGGGGAEATMNTGNSNTQTGGDTGNKEEVKPVKLKAVLTGPGKQQDSDKVWAEFNNRLQEYLPNTTVEFSIIEAPQYKQQWDLMMASGEEIDIAWTGYAIPFSPEVQKGSYKDLTSLIEDYAPDLKKEIPQWLFDIGSFDGKVYQMPKYEINTDLRIGMYMPKTHLKYWDFDRANEVFGDTSSQFRTWTKPMFDVFEAYLEKANADNALQSGFSQWVMGYGGVTLLGGKDAPVIRRPNPGQEWDFTVLNQYDTEEVRMFYETMADWYKKGYIRKDVITLQNPRQYENSDTAEGNIAWFHNYVNAADPDADFMDIIRWKMPAVQVPVVPAYYITNSNSTSGLTIPRTSKNPERAIQLIELLNTEKGKELYNLLVYGLEGEHYKKVSDNRIETIGYVGQGTADSKYGIFKWATGNVMNAYLTQADVADNLYKHYEAVHEDAIKSPLLAFHPDTTPVKNEYTQVNAVIAEFEKVLMSGALGDKWSSQYDDFLNKLKTAGVDKLTAEIQNQLDAYLEANKIPKTAVMAE